jgi:ectoine hydroxylase-related dioxygenase (phytanoyl-CoA dioxygenase family)
MVDDASTELVDVSELADVSQRLRCDGYAVLPARLGDESVARARDELGQLLSAAPWGTGFDGTRTRRVWAPLAVTRCMDAAALDPLTLAVVEQALGPATQFGITCAIQVYPGQGAQVLHYDQNLYPLPRDRDVTLTTMWALDDFTAENGATRIVPGSHDGPARKPDRGETVPAQMPAGSVLIFSGRLYHGAGPNISDHPRLGVVIEYIQPWLRPCEAHTLSADLAQVRLLPQRLQELLGFNQPSPYLGFVNGQHPREWLMSR